LSDLHDILLSISTLQSSHKGSYRVIYQLREPNLLLRRKRAFLRHYRHHGQGTKNTDSCFQHALSDKRNVLNLEMLTSALLAPTSSCHS